MLGFYNYTVILTYMSLFSAVTGITLAFSENIPGHTFWAVFCLLFSGFCDMFDGKVAKTMKRTEDEKKFKEVLEGYKAKYIDALDDDFNTADGISVIFEIVADVNRNISAESSKEMISFALDLIRELTGVLGLLSKDKKDEISPEIQSLLDARAEARANKDWAKSDEIRDALKEMGIIVKDTAQGQQISFE